MRGMRCRISGGQSDTIVNSKPSVDGFEQCQMEGRWFGRFMGLEMWVPVAHVVAQPLIAEKNCIYFCLTGFDATSYIVQYNDNIFPEGSSWTHHILST